MHDSCIDSAKATFKLYASRDPGILNFRKKTKNTCEDCSYDQIENSAYNCF